MVWYRTMKFYIHQYLLWQNKVFLFVVFFFSSVCKNCLSFNYKSLRNIWKFLWQGYVQGEVNVALFLDYSPWFSIFNSISVLCTSWLQEKDLQRENEIIKGRLTFSLNVYTFSFFYLFCSFIKGVYIYRSVTLYIIYKNSMIGKK